MKKKKRTFMSQKIIQRIQTRRKNRIDVALRVSLWFTIIFGIILLSHLEAVKIKMIDAPSWADFSKAPQLLETAVDKNPDGVPSKLTINGQRWSIVQVDHFYDAVGHKNQVPFTGIHAETYCKNLTIAYIQTLDPQEIRVMLMHEIFHAGACLYGGDTWWNSEHPNRIEHIGIYHLGEFMAIFLHDNPKFAEWEAQP